MQSLAPACGIEPRSPLDRYQPLIGGRAIERLLRKARRLDGFKVLHVNSTRQSGGAAEILSSLTHLMNDIGIETEWRVIEGSPDEGVLPTCSAVQFQVLSKS